MKKIGFCFFIGYFLLACTKTGTPPFSASVFDCTETTSNETSPLGINLLAPTYFNDSHWFFIDAFTKASHFWFATSTSLGFTAGTISSYDSNGWPTGVTGDTRPAVLLFSRTDGGVYPTGTYVIHWEGSGGSLLVDNDATNLRCENGNEITNCPSQRGLFDVNSTSDDGILILIAPDDASTYNSSNYIRNIRVLMPGGVCGRSSTDLDLFEYCESSRGGQGSCDSGESCFDFDDVHWNRFSDEFTEIHNPKVLFHPHSMRGLRKYRAIRYQEFNRSQSTTVTTWASRATKEHYSWDNANGPPPELTAYLSNLINADAWVNIPYRGTDDYVTNYASYLLSTLKSNLKIYLEYTNEHWNPDTTDFPQSAYMLTQAQSNGIGVGETDLVRKNMYYASRAIEVFDAWNGVWAGQTDRVIRLMGGWGGFPAVGRTLMSQSGVAERTDAIIIGPYLGTHMTFSEVFDSVRNYSLNDFFNEMWFGGLSDEVVGGGMAQVKQFIDDYVTIAGEYNIDLIGYESGSHLWSNDTENEPTIQNLFQRADSDARMGDLYIELYNYWRSVGGKLINSFAFMRPRLFDQFGNLPNELAACEDNPKEGSVNQFIRQNPCWWDNCNITQ